MRSTFTLPVLAAFALSACGGEADEAVSDEALSADEVAVVIEDNGLQPGAGEYSVRTELIEFDAPGLSEASIAEARAEFESGAGAPYLYCVTEGITREAWFSQMVESECTLSRFSANGDALEGVMSCTAPEGLNGRVEVAGTSDADSSDLRMTATVPTSAGEGTVRFRVLAEATGEGCGQVE